MQKLHFVLWRVATPSAACWYNPTHDGQGGIVKQPLTGKGISHSLLFGKAWTLGEMFPASALYLRAAALPKVTAGMPPCPLHICLTGQCGENGNREAKGSML